MPISTATVFRNAVFSQDYSVAPFSVWKTLVAPIAVKSGRDTVASYLAICLISVATRNAHSFYKLFMYHFQTKSYVNCPKDMKRHTAMFMSAHKNRRRPITYHSVYLAKSARKRLQPAEAGSQNVSPRIWHVQFLHRSRESRVRSQQSRATSHLH
jgi:hypothetical protein